MTSNFLIKIVKVNFFLLFSISKIDNDKYETNVHKTCQKIPNCIVNNKCSNKPRKDNHFINSEETKNPKENGIYGPKPDSSLVNTLP